MDPIDIAHAYDTITHLWSSNNFDKNNGIEQHRRAISFANKKGKALDVGCGPTGRFIELLQSEGFEPEGLDLSVEMLRLAKKKHPKIQFHHENICEWKPSQKYTFITAWDSIWHIPLSQQKNVLSKLISSLTVNGILIFSFGGTTEAGEHRDSTMGPEVYYSSLGTNGFLKLFIELGCICKHLEYDQYPELHTYLIVEKVV